MKTQILTTKLTIPSARRMWVPRPRLLERLDEGRSLKHRLTLVSAPAGAGKTTLISRWIHERHLSAAWISLDAHDNDPQRFWIYVVTALQTMDPRVGPTLLKWLRSPQPPPLEKMITALINDLVKVVPHEQDSHFLVLDDYHAIMVPEIHDSLDDLLRHVPPRLQLVILTREDPPLALPRLRSRGQLTEIRTGDLRFTPEEAAQLFGGVMGLDLPDEDVTALAERTEGWAVGLQMAGLSMQRETPSNQRAFVRTFAGNDRLVADYLTDEVLDHQRSGMRAFLLQTSILERLSGPLCDAVTGRDGCQQRLLELEQANLFLVPLDRKRIWYRYHHLFADLLRHRLQRQRGLQTVRDLHRKAGEWYAGEGLWEDAVRHALEATDDERAADLVAQAAPPALMRGEFVLVKRWLDALPDDLVRARPILCIARAWCTLPYSVERARQWIERAGSTAHNCVDQGAGNDIQAHIAALRVTVAHTTNASRSTVIELCQDALVKIPERDTELRAVVVYWMGEAYLALGDSASADRAFERVMQIERDSESHTMSLVMKGIHAWRDFIRGHLHEAAATCRQMMRSVVEPAEEAGWDLPMACYLYIVLGQIHYQWNELDRSVALLRRGIELGEMTPLESPILVEGYTALARVRAVQGKFGDALRLMDKAEQTGELWLAEGDVPPALRVPIWLRQAQVEGCTPCLDRAIAWADAYAVQRSDGYSPELQSVAHVRIAQSCAYGAPDLDPVLSILDEQLTLADASGRTAWQIEARMLKALTLQAKERGAAALGLLECALALAKPERFMRAIVDYGPSVGALLRQVPRQNSMREYARGYAREYVRGYARELLAILVVEEGDERPAAQVSTDASTTLVEPLTPRELEVLAVIATGVSNAEIAQSLYISVNTVKTHITNIFGKLEVTRRVEAVARGRELGLID